LFTDVRLCEIRIPVPFDPPIFGSARGTGFSRAYVRVLLTAHLGTPNVKSLNVPPKHELA
jgi:hypothetical protein